MNDNGFPGLKGNAHNSDRNLQFLEMALPGLCMTCARMHNSSSGSKLSIVDPGCDRCIDEPHVSKSKWNHDLQLTPPTKWDGLGFQSFPQQQQQRQQQQQQLQQLQQMKQQQQPYSSRPELVHRVSIESAFSNDSNSTYLSRGVDDSFSTTYSSTSPNASYASKPIYFGDYTNHRSENSQDRQKNQFHQQQYSPLEWPDFSKWIGKGSVGASSPSERHVRESFGSIGSAPFLSENVGSLDDAPLLSRSPSPVSLPPSPKKLRNSAKPISSVNNNNSSNSSPTTLSIPSAPKTSSLVGDGITKSTSSLQQALMHPAKTGFALWVGNLSPKTTLPELRILFGTPDLQSIYLIQRTGCAFVNYNTLDALEVGMKLFEKRGAQLHDNNLVIKAQISSDEEENGNSNSNSNGNNIAASSAGSAGPKLPTSAPRSPDRFFICKSLTVDDLEMAKKTRKWSTQLRNKDKFNSAFERAKNTYLVFSANRTSAFYGIAKLEEMFNDPQNENSGSVVQRGPDSSVEETRNPEVNHTVQCFHPQDSTFIPSGLTVFDPLRGSLFWKVEGCPCVEPETEKWTSPAQIRWISAPNSIVPFSSTRQLKNNLNLNKPIKVARDGTEIDPEVGARLFKMFHTII